MSRLLYHLITALTRLAVHAGRAKDLEIIVLCHQLTLCVHENSIASLTS